MYFASVILLLVVLPIVSIAAEAALSHHAMNMALVGRWFVFWGVGVRLFLAGVRQVVQPRFTAEEIFGIHDTGSFAIVREVGFANLSMGFLGVLHSASGWLARSRCSCWRTLLRSCRGWARLFAGKERKGVHGDVLGRFHLRRTPRLCPQKPDLTAAVRLPWISGQGSFAMKMFICRTTSASLELKT